MQLDSDTGFISELSILGGSQEAKIRLCHSLDVAPGYLKEEPKFLAPRMLLKVPTVCNRTNLTELNLNCLFLFYTEMIRDLND